MMPAECQDYRSYLRQELTVRMRKNPRYSLRAFARDLGMAPSKVSEVLRGLGGLSRASAIRVARRLGYTETETRHFVALVELQHRSELKRSAARKVLEALRVNQGFGILDLERFQVIADWHHNAILELVTLNDFVPRPKWIADRLGISQAEAEGAIARLMALGLLMPDPQGKGWIRPAEGMLATPSGVPSRAIRAHHQQILRKAEASLESVPVEFRDFSTLTLAIDSGRIEEAKEDLREFRRKFCVKMQERSEKDRVYCLAIQFFPLENGDPELSRQKERSQ
ncbi:MAG: TIGR02147 family protein [Oligoflexia bacterium]|nr:TIGR02147 family protein [Oligoflexia bacterium]